MKEAIKIRASSKRNGLTLLIAGIAGLVFTLMLISFDVITHPAISYSFCIISAITGIIGLFKVREPEFSVMLDDTGISYFHIKGSWHVSWDNLQRCDQLSYTLGIERQELPYVGISIKDIEPLLGNISPRLASGILNEQRELVMLALREDFDSGECPNGTCPSDALFDTSEFKLNGVTYKGLMGMFANRLAMQRQKLGYELYIPITALADPQEFVQQVREFRQIEVIN